MTSQVFYHLSGDLSRVRGFGICRGTFFVSGPENFQFYIVAGFRVQFFNLQILTGFYPVLFSTSFNNCVHNFILPNKETKTPPKTTGV